MNSDAPWLTHYDEGVPQSLAPYPNRTLLDYVADAARDHPDDAALTFKGATVTYAALKRVIATNIKEYFPPLLRMAFTLLREKRDGDRVRLVPGDHDFAHLLLVNRGRKPQRVPLTANDPAVLLMSGGTTGTPKGVLGK